MTVFSVSNSFYKVTQAITLHSIIKHKACICIFYQGSISICPYLLVGRKTLTSLTVGLEAGADRCKILTNLDLDLQCYMLET